jgi:hypothetical protein
LGEQIFKKIELLFRVMKYQFGFQKILSRGMSKKRCKINVIAVSANIFLPSRLFPAAT